MLTLALSKGRILSETLPLLKQAGIEPLEDLNSSRKLIFPTNREDVRLLIIRASDVATYVQFGAADAGVAGKDLLLEHGGEGLYELLDLKIACCRMVVAGPEHQSSTYPARMRVASKYPNITRLYFSRLGVQAEIIKLYGSMELAPLVGLSDRIVDLVDTGNTLRANGLVEMETIAEISSRFVVNRASMKMNSTQLTELIDHLRNAVDNY
ncbi:MAG: ATP phosphoribosyltransferase [Parasphingorhabdus sp.]|jgi:ATP phosphoribosyltransferase